MPLVLMLLLCYGYVVYKIEPVVKALLFISYIYPTDYQILIAMKQCLFIFAALLFSYNLTAQSDFYQLTGALLGETPIEEDLQELCDDIGGRVTGSKANEAAVKWALQKFKTAGLSAQKEAFQMPVRWLEKSTTAKVQGSINFAPQLVAKYQSPVSTYKGRLVYVGMGKAADFEKVKDRLQSSFILVETDLCLDINGLFAEYTHAAGVELEAKKYGVQGIIFMASRPGKLLYRFITMEPMSNQIPQLVMAREDAKRCIRVLQKGEVLDIVVTIDAEVGGEFTAHNVIAEIKGTEKPDEVVIIGSHIDSWALGTGANDNGCNVSLMIDIARQMKKLGIRPKRTIRFALWNGEEQGYFGSWAYTKQHEDELDKHIMAMSVDIGSGAITGFFTNGSDQLPGVVEKLLQPVAALGDYTNINYPIVGTDNFDFMLQGVANLVANHKPQLYGRTYHSASDTYDKVDLKALKINSAIVAAVTLGFANMPAEQISWERLSKAEIQQVFDAVDLEFTLRMFGVWDAWIKGERGRTE